MNSSDAVTALGALAQPTRLDIFRLLVRIGPPGLAAGEIAARLGLAAPTLSFHLKTLLQAGLLRCRRESRSLIYVIDFARMQALVDFLTEHCCAEPSVLCPIVNLPERDATMSEKLYNVLFLCTGNSCRSQMCEGYGRAFGAELIEVRSAGIEAHGQNPRAIAVMAADGVDISGQASTRLDDAMLAWADLVVTVCGHADEHCPLLPPGVAKQHWPFDDPAKVTGTAAEIEAAFATTRDRIRARVQGFVDGLRAARLQR